MATKLDIAKRLYSARGARAASEASAGGVAGTSGSASVRYGYAQADSADGWVQVKLDNSDDTVNCTCDSPISEGQRVSVIVTSTGQLKALPIGNNILDAAVGGSVTNVVTEYAAGTSDTVAPTNGWSESYPTTADYVWQRLKTTKGDGTVSYSTPVCIAKPPEGYDRDATYYATSPTSGATSAKTATVQSGGSFSLEEGATVSVTFVHGNTASNPTLNVSGTGAKPIRTNGTPYAYWADGASVLFVYDGTYWQVASSPVYASTTTVGNPASKNVYIDGSHVAIRNGTTEYSTFTADDIHLGLNASSDSNIYLFNDTMRMAATSGSDWDGSEASLEIGPVPGVDPGRMLFKMDDDAYLSIVPRSSVSMGTLSATTLSNSTIVNIQALDSTGGGIVNVTTGAGRTQFSSGYVDMVNVGSIQKPACSIGWEGRNIALSSANKVLTADRQYYRNGLGTTSIGTVIERSGNYIYVTVQERIISCPVEVSCIVEAQGISNTNFAAGIECEPVGYGSVSPSSYPGGVVTANGYATITVPPCIFELEGGESYRFSCVARTTNATGNVQLWQMTVRML